MAGVGGHPNPTHCPDVPLSRYPSFLLSWCPSAQVSRFLVSWFLSLPVSQCPGFLESWCLGVPVLKCPGVSVSLFTGFPVPGHLGLTEKRTQRVFGTSVRRSSRSAFGRSTGNDVSGHYYRHSFSFLFLRRRLFS